jgi:ribosomal-protein-serine acetyltransferase
VSAVSSYPPFAPVQIDGLTLRRVKVRDAHRWAEHVRADLAHLGEHLPWPAATTATTRAAEFISRYAHGEDGRVLLVGGFDGDRMAGGTVLMSYEPWLATLELGCWVISEYEGRGLVRRMCVHTLRYARAELNVHRVEWRCAIGNARSRALAERLGFSLEGTLREAAAHQGARQDLYLFSLIGPEIDAVIDLP